MPRTQLDVVPTVMLDSPTLVFDKLHAYDDFDDFKTTQRDSWLLQVAGGVHASAKSTYQGWYKEFAQASHDAQADSLLVASTEGRLVIGWATNPGIEIGLTLNRLYGFPYLPGSAVKGLVHRVAELDLLEGANPLPPFGEASFTAAPSENLIASLQRCALVRAIFGSLHVRRPDGSDLPPTPLEHLEAWKAALTAQEEQTPEWSSILAQLQVLCGAENLGGVANFFDAVPEPQSLLHQAPLQPDVLTPHYSRYYKDLDCTRPTMSPEDRKEQGDVNPIRFLAVRPGLKFEFRIRVRMPRSLTDGPGLEQDGALGGRGGEAIRELLRGWLTRGLQEYGIGAKTAAGYGYLEPVAGPRLPRGLGPAPELDPIAYAATFLPPKLPMGILAQKVDEARTKLTKAQQAAVARRLRELYPEAVAAWRKQKNKPSAQERAAWIEAVTAPLGGSGEKP